MDTIKKTKMGQRTVIGLGELYETFITALPVLSAVQFISILAVLYNQYHDWLVGIWVGITLLKFILILSGIMAVAMVLVYKFLIPSLWTFRGKQLYGFESTLLNEVKELREDIANLTKVKEEKKE